MGLYGTEVACRYHRSVLLGSPFMKELAFSCEMADSLQGQCFHRMSQLLSQDHTPPWWWWRCTLSYVQLFAALWTVTHQAPLSMEFSRQEYWSGLPFPSPGSLPNSGIKPMSLAFLALGGRFFTSVPPGKPTLLPSGPQTGTEHNWGCQGLTTSAHGGSLLTQDLMLQGFTV